MKVLSEKVSAEIIDELRKSNLYSEDTLVMMSENEKNEFVEFLKAKQLKKEGFFCRRGKQWKEYCYVKIAARNMTKVGSRLPKRTCLGYIKELPKDLFGLSLIIVPNVGKSFLEKSNRRWCKKYDS